MIAHLRGTITKGSPGEVTTDVGGVGYRVFVPITTWDELKENTVQLLWTVTYVREDRFDLFGFADANARLLFEHLIALQGIGPKLGLELCSVPRGLLHQAVAEQDPSVLTSIKGVGRKTAEKLLIELKGLMEKHPSLLQSSGKHLLPAAFDQDAIAALSQLGYTTSDIIHVLEKLPKDLRTTEERVTAALRNL